MDKENIYILGAGGMAREVKAYYDDLGRGDSVKGFVEQNSHRSGVEHKGKVIFDADDLQDPANLELIAGIGSPLRKKWIEELEKQGYQFDTLVHTDSYVGEDVSIGQGSIVCPGAILTTDIKIGKHCIINVNASISHDCSLGNFVSVSPGASIGGGVEIGDESWIGIGATVIQKIKIGKRVFIAAGAVIVDDIPDDSLVVGVPGRVVRKLTPESWKELI